jgi:hypothetical protein
MSAYCRFETFPTAEERRLWPEIRHHLGIHRCALTKFDLALPIHSPTCVV